MYTWLCCFMCKYRQIKQIMISIYWTDLINTTLMDATLQQFNVLSYTYSIGCVYVQNLHNPFMVNKLSDGFSHEKFICSHWKYFIAIINIIIIIITNFHTVRKMYKKGVSCMVKALSTRSCKFYARGNDVCWIDALEILWMETLRPFLQSFNKVIRQKAKALYVIRSM